MKKLLAVMLALVMVIALGVPMASADGKTVINVMSFTDEVPNMINRYLELNPDFASAQENLGIAFAMKGRVDEAISHLNRAHELDPANQRILKNLAMAYHQKGDVANETKVRQLLQE